MRLIEAYPSSAYGDKTLRRQRQRAWRRGIWMMRGDINTLWRMNRLLGENAGLVSNA